MSGLNVLESTNSLSLSVPHLQHEQGNGSRFYRECEEGYEFMHKG